MIFLRLIFYFLSFFLIWYCTGVVVDKVQKTAKRLNISSFALSFFVLGVLTSIPEASIGINSILNKTPDIFVGNLIGASLVIFIFIIPLLSIFGKGVKMIHQLKENEMIFALIVVSAPLFLIADNLLTRTESVFLILIYGILVYFIEKKKGLFHIGDFKKVDVFHQKNFFQDALEFFLALLIIFFLSKFIVKTTVILSNLLNISSFLVSLIILSLGSNIPEIALAVRSVVDGKKEVALGDYLGSASANTLIFGLMTFLNRARINIERYSLQTLIIFLFGLFVFYIFSMSKKEISPKEGKILLLIYLLFLLSETLF